jgi:hypothetical protein
MFKKFVEIRVEQMLDDNYLRMTDVCQWARN